MHNPLQDTTGLDSRRFSKLRRILKRNKIIRQSSIASRRGYRKIRDRITYLIVYKIFRCHKTFSFGGKQYRYHYTFSTRDNERVIEIPIAWEIVKMNMGKKILEVGNVLSHYFEVKYDIVDKYEIAEGVINQDIVDYPSNVKYDLIVSISTLEHVGYDEHVGSFVDRDPTKLLQAVERLQQLVDPVHGMIFVTLPLGYNLQMDQLIKNDTIVFSEKHYLKRFSKANEWRECNREEVKNIEYGKPFPAANGLLVGIVRNNKIVK